jgi:putative transposase
MDLPVRRKLPHAIPQWVADGSWFFITINCVPPGKNQLCLTPGAFGRARHSCARRRLNCNQDGAQRTARPTVGEAVLAAMRFNHERFLWQCRLCLLMPDHLHAIMAFPSEPGMATTIKNWKKFVAGKHGVDWQRDFFDHRLRNHHELEEKTSYVLMNPVRKGLCQRVEDWVWVYRPNDRPPPQW